MSKNIVDPDSPRMKI